MLTSPRNKTSAYRRTLPLFFLVRAVTGSSGVGDACSRDDCKYASCHAHLVFHPTFRDTFSVHNSMPAIKLHIHSTISLLLYAPFLPVSKPGKRHCTLNAV